MAPSSIVCQFCLLERLHSWTRNGVAVQVVVNVNENTRISPLVERRRASATGSLRSRTTNHKVDTLRVVLSSIVAPGSVQRDNLMTKHVRASFQRRGNRDDPGVVVGDEIVSAPCARCWAALQADLIDFGELEGGLVDLCAVVVGAGGEVVQHRAFVARRPGVPEELYRLPGDDGDVGFAWCTGLVADDVSGLVAVG